jgi:signal transduction histidine kinase
VLAVSLNRKGRARKRRRSAKSIRDRLAEAEATLEAIRTGQVDALVVSGPRGEQTLTIEGATHPYFVLLNAMNDGAALLELDGAILFGNRSFAGIAGVPVETLRASMFQRLVVSAQRSSFEAFLREGARQKVAREFALITGNGSSTPVAIALSTLPLETYPGVAASESRDSTSLLMAIITDLTYRKAVEATRTRLLERLISAEDQERRRIARELHDETGQSLTAMLVGLRAITDMAVPPEVRPVALRLRDIAAHTVDNVGRLARGLHPAVLDDKGLAAAARRYVGDYVRSFGTALDFAAGDLDTPRLAPLAAATMYRILQETLTNVARHARARNVVVELKRDESAIELLVRDDGVGFEVTPAYDALSGLGLHGMRERVALLGGSIEIESAPGLGTVVRARIPAGSTAPSLPTKRRRRRHKRVRRNLQP